MIQSDFKSNVCCVCFECFPIVFFIPGNTQIIGMSATLNNIEDLQNFLKADVYHNDFRPVRF